MSDLAPNSSELPEVKEEPEPTPNDLPLVMASSEPPPAYPIEMCLRATNPNLPSFLYKFTGDDGAKMCYRFRLNNRSARCLNKEFSVYCTGCSYERYNRKNRDAVPMKTRRTDGYKLLDNPFLDHLSGCTPLDYYRVVRLSPPVTKEVRDKIIRGEVDHDSLPIGQDRSLPKSIQSNPRDSSPRPISRRISSKKGERLEYQLTMVVKNKDGRIPMFLYPLRDQPGQCYKFICINSNRRHANAPFYVVCSSCVAVYTKERRRTGNAKYPRKRRIDEDRMLCNPLSDHTPGCVIADYEKALATTHRPDEVARERIIRKEAHLENSSGVNEASSPVLSKEDVDDSMDGVQCADVVAKSDNDSRMSLEDNEKSVPSDHRRSPILHLPQIDLPDFIDTDSLSISTSYVDGILTVVKHRSS